MKKSFSLMFFLVLLWTASFGQDRTVYHPSSVLKPVYFDVSPPLRDMVQMNYKFESTWKDGIVKNNLHAIDDRTAPDDNAWKQDTYLQKWMGKSTTDTTIQNFDGISGDGQSVPPDTYGAVGPNHYFQVINVKYAIYNKDGVKLFGPSANSSVFTGMPHNHNDGDAVVLYDVNADRWMFSQFSLPNYPNGPFYQMVAVSQTPDPTGSWYRYEYQFSDMCDYPKFGTWVDGYYMTVNRFTAGALTYKGTATMVMQRDSMLAGSANAAIIQFQLSSGDEAYCLLPADCTSAFPPLGTPEYVAYLNDGPDHIGVFQFVTDWTNTANSTFTRTQKIDVSAFSGQITGGIPQKGTSIKLDPLSGRLMYRLPFHMFSDHWSIVANATVNVGSSQAGIRWFELRSTGDTWSIYQQGTYSPDANSRWMGSIDMNDNGDIALGYSVSSSTMFPSIRYTGRLSGDPLNTMSIEEKGIINGGGSQLNNWSGNNKPSRWGDYSSLTADPSVLGKFWYTQEYYSSSSDANYKTRIASFNFSSIFAIGLSATPPVICIGQSSNILASANGGSGNYTYSWTSDPAGFTSNQSSVTVSPLVTTYYICSVSDGTNTKTDSLLLTVNGLATAFAGNDTTYPNTITAFQVFGQAANYKSLHWTTSGDGHFSLDTVATTVYFTGTQDRANGGVNLSLSASALPPCTAPAGDMVHITLSWPQGTGNLVDGPFGIFLSPNPSDGIFDLTVKNLPDPEAIITISDLQGKILFTDKVTGPSQSTTRKIVIPGITKGVYIVKVKSDNDVRMGKMVVK